jgi:hypothetical protein
MKIKGNQLCLPLYKQPTISDYDLHDTNVLSKCCKAPQIVMITRWDSYVVCSNCGTMNNVPKNGIRITS